MSEPQTTSEPESESEEEEEEEETTEAPAAASTTTQASGSGMTCTAAPNLNRGVTDADCATCETGYHWWPCNEAILCDCTGSLLSVDREEKAVKKHRFLGLIQTSEDVQKGSWTAWEDEEEEEL